ncbi:MFS general substrate transporter [Glarea lozoyensis ATCC 20868]|uniref:MFS general substrate transporter n=1 Tax=Glarea lozoyensis (strain ATCC 20868 / MF5171) TaxID=1116229 RepID=S3CK79_GLAL2|nr:MFS general substrate transporter [Glarea lozoyensis ATCC 20868]EPE25624.1 MFS general substrate transporter [Glarea lozoyensis ATCC 20868]
MGITSRLNIPFMGRNSTSTNGDTSQGEKQTYQNAPPIPIVTIHSFIMGVFVSIGGFVFGYDTGQISGFLGMKDFKERFGQRDSVGDGYHFSNVRSGLIVALLSIGTLMGALTAGPVADRIGRKWSISAWCIMLHVGLIVQMTAEQPKWYQIVVGRWIAGLGVGALSLLVPMYQSESAPRHIRGALISTYQLFITIGIFVANCINFGTEKRNDTGSWRIPLGISFLWVIILGFGIIFFPESPRYDYRHGRTDQAKETMRKLYGVSADHPVLAEEFAEIHAKYEEEQLHKNQKWYEMFTAPRMAYRIALGVTLQSLQQLTGANYFFYYGTVIFTSTGIHNSYVTQMILGGVNFGSTFLGLYVVEHFGRRKSLVFGAMWMFVCFMVFASVGHFSLDRDVPENSPHAGKAMIVFACLFILGFATTWGPIVWTICAELYPSRYRSKAMGISTAANWFWNFLLAFFTPFIVGDIDFRYGYIFASCLFLAAATVYFFVIEGRGRTLEEIDTMYLLHVDPRKSAGWVAPPPDQLITTEKLVSGGVEAGVPNLEAVNKETAPGPTTTHNE